MTKAGQTIWILSTYSPLVILEEELQASWSVKELAVTLEAGDKAGFLLGFRGYDRINYQSDTDTPISLNF
jgi:hypothetical protein